MTLICKKRFYHAPKIFVCNNTNKQAQEVIFSEKLQKSTHLTLSFNNNTVTQSVTQKHLGMLLDTKLDFQGHLKIYSIR